MSEVQSQYVDLKVADGSSMRAWLASPSEKEVEAGLMVFQEAFGVNHHIRALTDRFAQAGYLAIAPELYHRTSPGFEGDYSDSGPAIALARQLTPEGTENDARATHSFLRERVGDKIVCTGYCMGGRVSFVANTAVPLRAAASYYGGGLADAIGPCVEVLRAHAVLLGRAGQAHYCRAAAKSRRRHAGFAASVDSGDIL